MAKSPLVKYNLRRPQSQSETLISLVFRYRGQKLVYSTGYSIYPQDWNAKTQRLAVQRHRNDLFLIKRQLDDLAVHCLDIYIENGFGAISMNNFKLALDAKINDATGISSDDEDDKIGFLEFLDLEIAEMKLAGFLSKVRDICLVGAGTGRRWSDFSRYSQDHFYRTLKGVIILSVISTKTDTPVKVPVNLFPWLIPVLERNDYATPKMSMQKFNEGLKQLCKLAGFDERLLIVEQYISRKAVVKKSFAPKHELVSSHICRRSFATNLYRMGYSLAQIMPMTGHATESQLRKYIGINGEMNAEEIAPNIMAKQSRQTDGGAKVKALGA